MKDKTATQPDTTAATRVDEGDEVPEGSISVGEQIGIEEIAAEVTREIEARTQCP